MLPTPPRPSQDMRERGRFVPDQTPEKPPNLRGRQGQQIRIGGQAD